MLKSILRPFYAALIKAPPLQFILKEELAKRAATPWDAHVQEDFINGDAGKDHGLGPSEKENLVEQFHAITSAVESGTSPLVHTLLARAILSIPPDTQGDVIECGAWKGASTASLSLICAAAKRKLLVCDSFQGLPDDGEQLHKGLHTKVYGYYKEGMFKGALDEVQGNVELYGDMSVCQFIPGFFNVSLKAITDPIAFAFLDVDLVDSTKDCLRHIWPLLLDDGYIYSDDAGDLAVVRIYFDDSWWQKNLNTPAPGYIGSGCGLPLNPIHSSLGYTQKQTNFDKSQYKKAPFLHYPNEK